MQTKKLVLFYGNLNTLNIFIDQLKAGFYHLGYEILDFDLEDTALSLGKLYQFLQDGPVTAAIAFNCPFFGFTMPSGANVWEQLRIPCINILVDHPFWYHKMLEKTPSTGILLCIDRDHMRYIQRFYPGIGTTGFLPHGGTPAASEPRPLTERKIDVLYAGSLYADYIQTQKPDFFRFDFPAEEISRQTISYLFAHPKDTIEAALEYFLKAAGICLSEQELCRFLSACGPYIERNVSSHFRKKVLETIARAGISLNLYGEGWSRCDWIHLPNVNYGGMISPEAVLQEMEDAKIVVNTMPWFKDGSHERIFNGMLRGCVVFSETSAYLEETLPENTWEKFALQPEDISSIPERIKALLEQESAAQAVADAGYALVKEKHTWQNRAEELHRDLLEYL